MKFDILVPPPLFRVVLVEPEIPNNTGNIGRICVGLSSELAIVGKPAFEISDKRVKRAGLDYWKDLNLKQYDTWGQWKSSVHDMSRVFLFSTKAKKSFYELDLKPGDTFVFGKETLGLSQQQRDEFPNQVVALPMFGPIRSQNLANTVAVAMYEGVRQFMASKRGDFFKPSALDNIGH